MRVLIRAAGLAAAAFTVATGAAFADTSRTGAGPTGAGDLTDTASYTDHLADTATPNDIAIDSLSAAGFESSAEVAAPVAEHSLASVEAVVASATDLDGIEGDPARPLVQLVSDYASSEVSDAEMECLAIAVYFEAKSEPLVGQLAVAEVIVNRTRSGRFPSSICGVVKQRGQFSFVRGGRLPYVPRASRDWREAVAIAHIARGALARGAAPKALFFHARRVSPGWRLTRVAAVGNHVFYK